MMECSARRWRQVYIQIFRLYLHVFSNFTKLRPCFNSGPITQDVSCWTATDRLTPTRPSTALPVHCAVRVFGRHRCRQRAACRHVHRQLGLPDPPDLIHGAARCRRSGGADGVMAQPEFAATALTARGGGTGTNGQSTEPGRHPDLRRHEPPDRAGTRRGLGRCRTGQWCWTT